MIAQSAWNTRRLLRFAVENTTSASHAGKSGLMLIRHPLYRVLFVVKVSGNRLTQLKLKN